MGKKAKATNSGLAVVYTRVSTAGQADTGVSLDAQEAACRRWCEQQGLSVLLVCTDAGVSGAAEIADCPGLMDALTALQANPGTVLLAHRRDRFARDVVRAVTLEKLAAATGGRLETVEGVSGNGPEEVLMRMISDAFSQFTRAKIAGNTRMALSHKKANGERVGTCPRGFRDDGAGRLVADESEQLVLSLVRQLRGQGMTLRAIADELGRQGFATRRGKPFDFTLVGKMLRAA
jgi:site-specific DNA recombinase